MFFEREGAKKRRKECRLKLRKEVDMDMCLRERREVGMGMELNLLSRGVF